MALRLIVKEGDEVLTRKCRPVEVFDEKLGQLLDDMAQTMYAAEGVGLAGPQVGVLRRVCVIDAGTGLIELVNPEVVKATGVQETPEGCLSSPGKCGITRRPRKVTVSYQDRYGQPHTMKGEDLLAKAFCHEIDHLDGILFARHVIHWES